MLLGVSGLARKIVIANQKGGVGKTTTAVNLSACLAELGQRTLLVDSDPQGNATSGLGVDKRAVQTSIYDVMINGVPASQAVRKTDIQNLFLLPSNIDLAGAEIEMVSMLSRETILSRAILEIQQDYDFMLLDAPPSLGLLTLNALAAADQVLIPIQCEFYALEGLSQLMNTIKLVKKHINPRLEIEGVVAHHVRFPHKPFHAGCGRGKKVLFRKGAPGDYSTQCAAGRGAEPWPAHHKIRCKVRRLGGVYCPGRGDPGAGGGRMSSKKGLGKGLGALMGSMDLPEEEKGGVLEIPVNLIDPLKTQPRQNFDQEKLLELAESVKQHGILQPLILKAKNGRYSIIAGERRYRAAARPA